MTTRPLILIVLCLVTLVLVATGCSTTSTQNVSPWDTYFDTGQYNLAIQEINQWIEAHPGHPLLYVPYNDRGECYRGPVEQPPKVFVLI